MKTKVSVELGFTLLLILCDSNHMQVSYREIFYGLF